MATTVSIEQTVGLGNYADFTNELLWGSLTVKLNTADFALIGVAPGSILLNAAVKLTDPAWSGIVASTTSSDPVDLRSSTQMICTVAATNTKALPTDTAPFDLSDVPTATPPFDYLLEDGSGHYLLESGTDFAPGALMLEGALAVGYEGLSVQLRTVGGVSQAFGKCVVKQPGLRPGNQFHLTTLGQGYTNALFRITQVTWRWPALSNRAICSIEFGDVPATYSQYIHLQ
jgi:hypothetical protein